MYCPNCGQKNGDDAVFCMRCGSRIPDAVQPEPMQPEPIRSEPIQPEPMQPEPIRSGPMQADTMQPGEDPYGEIPDAAAGPADDVYDYDAYYGQSAVRPDDRQMGGRRRISAASARLERNRAAYGGGYGYGYGRTPYAPRAAVSKWMLAAAAEFCALMFVIYLAAGAISQINSPEKTAERFFVSLVNGDMRKAFDSLGVEESVLVNADTFRLAVSEQDLSRVTNYTVRSDSGDTGGSGLGKTVTVLYRNEGDENDSYMDINVIKSGKKNEWYVSSNAYFSSNVRITVPSGGSVTVDGISLPEEYAEQNQDENGRETAVYTIPKIFKGTHYLTVSAAGREDASRTWSVYSDEDSCDMTDLLYSEEAVAELQQLAVSNMYQIYEAAMAAQDFSAVSGLFTGDPERQADIREDYDYLKERFGNDSTRVSAISFQEIRASTWNSQTDVDLSFAYTGNYIRVDSWNNTTSTETIEDTGSLHFEFVREDGAWVQTQLGCSSLYF